MFYVQIGSSSGTQRSFLKHLNYRLARTDERRGREKTGWCQMSRRANSNLELKKRKHYEGNYDNLFPVRDKKLKAGRQHVRS